MIFLTPLRQHDFEPTSIVCYCNISDCWNIRVLVMQLAKTKNVRYISIHFVNMERANKMVYYIHHSQSISLYISTNIGSDCIERESHSGENEVF
jgi:hypothetical protein